MSVGWDHVCGRFATFLLSLQPAPEEQRAARVAAASVADLLDRRFRRPDRDGPANGDSFHVIGGHSKGTAVRPAKTIDLLYVLPDRLRSEAGPRRDGRIGDLTPLGRDMLGVLSLRYAAVKMAREGWLAVSVDRRDGGPIGVRVVPAFACGSGGYLIAAHGLGPGRGPWRHADPAAEGVALRRADAMSGGKASHLVRMGKVWRTANAVPMGAFALELLAVEFVTLWTYQRRSLLFYDWLVRDFFFWLSAQAGRELDVPGGWQALDTGDGWASAAEEAYERAAAAAALERDNRADEALSLWRQLFGARFDDPLRPPPALGAWPWQPDETTIAATG